MSRKNKWRTRGNLQFKRKTSRLSDGTPNGDVLFIRIKKRACVFATLGPSFPENKIEFWANDGLYFRPSSPAQAANQLRRALYARANRTA